MFNVKRFFRNYCLLKPDGGEEGGGNGSDKGEGEDLTDEEIAILANKKLKEKDEELKKAKKEIAKLKLLSTADSENEEEPKLSKEDCIKVIGDGKTNNYDYANAVIRLREIELEDGKPDPLGKNGEQVAKFFSDVIEECGDNKSKFTYIYQAKIGEDEISNIRRR